MKKQLLCFSIMLMSVAASAKIRYTDVKPDTVLAATPAQGFARFDIDMNKDGTVDFYVKHFNPGGGFSPAAEFYTEVGGTGEVLVNSTDNPLALDEGASISATQTTWVNRAGAMFSSSLMMFPTFKGVGERYVGVRVQIANKWHYGWVKASVANGPASVTIYEYALNEKVEEAIAAGQTAPTAITNVAASEGARIYPNPMIETATAESPVPNATLVIYNQQGQLVRSLPTGNKKQMQLHREELNAGLYYYEFQQGGIRLAKGRLMIID